jgi:hypothetical protein
MSIQQTVKDGVSFLEQTIKDLTKERDYLDARCAELEYYEKLSHEWVKEKVEGLTTFEEVEKMVDLAERLNRQSAKEIIHCGWCKAEFDTKIEVQKHLIKCNKNPLVKRLVSLEQVCREFVAYQYPDAMCRERIKEVLSECDEKDGE